MDTKPKQLNLTNTIRDALLILAREAYKTNIFEKLEKAEALNDAHNEWCNTETQKLYKKPIKVTDTDLEHALQLQWAQEDMQNSADSENNIVLSWEKRETPSPTVQKTVDKIVRQQSRISPAKNALFNLWINQYRQAKAEKLQQFNVQTYSKLEKKRDKLLNLYKNYFEAPLVCALKNEIKNTSNITSDERYNSALNYLVERLSAPKTKEQEATRNTLNETLLGTDLDGKGLRSTVADEVMYFANELLEKHSAYFEEPQPLNLMGSEEKNLTNRVLRQEFLGGPIRDAAKEYAQKILDNLSENTESTLGIINDKSVDMHYHQTGFISVYELFSGIRYAPPRQGGWKGFKSYLTNLLNLRH